MEIISAKDFRARQGHFFGLANNGEDIIVHSREKGNFRIVPIKETETITQRVCQALKEVKMMQDGKIAEESLVGQES